MLPSEAFSGSFSPRDAAAAGERPPVDPKKKTAAAHCSPPCPSDTLADNSDSCSTSSPRSGGRSQGSGAAGVRLCIFWQIQTWNGSPQYAAHAASASLPCPESLHIFFIALICEQQCTPLHYITINIRHTFPLPGEELLLGQFCHISSHPVHRITYAAYNQHIVSISVILFFF